MTDLNKRRLEIEMDPLMARIKRCSDALLDVCIILEGQGFNEAEIYLALRLQTHLSRKMLVPPNGPMTQEETLQVDATWDRMLSDFNSEKEV